MSFARNITLAMLLCGLFGAAPASADYTSYYTYYRVKPGETLGSIAAKHGVHAGAIEAMNRNIEGELTPGTMICVPKQDEPVVAKKKRKKKKKKAKEEEVIDEDVGDDEAPTSEDLTEEELAYVTAYATKGAQRRVRRARLAAPRSYVIGVDGRVTYIPSAKPKAAPEPDEPQDHRRVKLSSRKGKLMHKLIRSCRSYLGVPYVWGGESPSGFDCSGYVQYVYAKHGIRLPRTADIQFNVGKPVKRGQELPADLVFFETYAPGASHVGVYLGNRYFIHASSSGMVKISSLSEEYFSARYLGARRHL